MESPKKYMYHLSFKLMILESNGQAFETLFTQIMNYLEPDFQQIKPHGNKGDRKNDGYIHSKDIYFQVYAPENPTENYSRTIEKAVSDFEKMFEFWNNNDTPVKEYYFVFNDKYLGVYPDCVKAIADLKSKHQLRNTGVWTAKDLENKLFTLEEDEIMAVLRGSSLDPKNMKVLHLPYVDEIIAYLRTLDHKLCESGKNVPNWDEKIKFNGLSKTSADMLANGSDYLADLDNYLACQSDYTSNELKGILSSRYQALKTRFSGDELFGELACDIVPNKTGDFVRCAIVVIAKYFETCDVFEEPPEDDQDYPALDTNLSPQVIQNINNVKVENEINEAQALEEFEQYTDELNLNQTKQEEIKLRLYNEDL